MRFRLPKAVVAVLADDFARSEFATKGTRNGLTHSEWVSKVTDAILHSKVTDSSITLYLTRGVGGYFEVCVCGIKNRCPLPSTPKTGHLTLSRKVYPFYGF